MARRFRKKYRQKRKYPGKRNFRRKYGSKKKIRKVRPVSGRMRVKGWKTKTNNRPEMKRTSYSSASINIRTYAYWDANMLATPNTSLLWSNNGVDRVPVPWFPWPVQGVGQNQFIGTKYKTIYVELMTSIAFNPQIIPALSQDIMRIFLIKERQPNQLYQNATDVFVNGAFFSPIDSKKWDVQFDKFYNLQTGLQSSDGHGNFYGTAQASGPFKFRWIIPMKHNMEASTNPVQFPYRFYLVAIVAGSDNQWATTSLNAIWYFKDP